MTLANPRPEIPDHASAHYRSEHYWPKFRLVAVHFRGKELRDSVVEFCVSEGWIRIIPNRRLVGAHGGWRKSERPIKLHGTVKPFWRQEVQR